MIETNPSRSVMPHTIARYQERVLPPGCAKSLADAARELLEAVSHPLFGCPCQGGWLLGCRNRAGYYFLAKQCSPNAPVETIGPTWFWHEARPFWRAAGINPNNTKKTNLKINFSSEASIDHSSIDFFAAADELA